MAQPQKIKIIIAKSSSDINFENSWYQAKKRASVSVIKSTRRLFFKKIETLSSDLQEATTQGIITATAANQIEEAAVRCFPGFAMNSAIPRTALKNSNIEFITSPIVTMPIDGLSVAGTIDDQEGYLKSMEGRWIKISDNRYVMEPAPDFPWAQQFQPTVIFAPVFDKSSEGFSIEIVRPADNQQLLSDVVARLTVKDFKDIEQVKTDIVDAENQPIYTGDHIVTIKEDLIKPSKLRKDALRFGLRIRTIDEFFKEDQHTSIDKALMTVDGILFPYAKTVLFKKGTEGRLSKLLYYSNYFEYAEPERFITVAGINRPQISAGNRDSATASWGNIVTNVVNASQTGKGVSIAIVDTGIDRNHPSFKGRSIEGESFIPGEDLSDHSDGHGTAVAGVACGGPRPEDGLRIGVAVEADLYCYKVLDKTLNGKERYILGAINKAIQRGVNVINVSLVARSEPDETKESRAIEKISKAARSQKSLVVAAVGNNAQRPSHKAPVKPPASCKSVIAVAAITPDLEIYYQSNSKTQSADPDVDISGPGQNILTCNIVNNGYSEWDGTSLAAPFVSGIAALYWQRNPAMTAEQIWQELKDKATNLSHHADDVGVGLVFFD